MRFTDVHKGLILLALCAGLCAVAEPSLDKAELQNLTRRAKAAVDAGNAEEALALYRTIQKSVSKGRASLLVGLCISEVHLMRKDYSAAYDEYASLYSEFKDSEKKYEILAGLAFVESRLGEVERSERRLDRIPMSEIRRLQKSTSDSEMKRWLLGLVPPEKSSASGTMSELEDSHVMQFFLAPSISLLNADTTDRSNGASATFASNLFPGVYFQLAVPVSRRLELWEVVEGRFVSMAAPEGRTLTQSQQMDVDFGIGAKFYPVESRRLGIAGQVGLAQEFFFRALSASDLIMDRVSAIPRLGLYASFDFVTWGDFKFGGEVGGAYFLSRKTDEQSVRNGYEYFGRLTALRRMTPKIDLRFSSMFLQQKLTTAGEERGKVQVGIDVGCAFRL